MRWLGSIQGAAFKFMISRPKTSLFSTALCFPIKASNMLVKGESKKQSRKEPVKVIKVRRIEGKRPIAYLTKLREVALIYAMTGRRVVFDFSEYNEIPPLHRNELIEIPAREGYIFDTQKDINKIFWGEKKR